MSRNSCYQDDVLVDIFSLLIATDSWPNREKTCDRDQKTRLDVSLLFCIQLQCIVVKLLLVAKKSRDPAVQDSSTMHIKPTIPKGI